MLDRTQLSRALPFLAVLALVLLPACGAKEAPAPPAQPAPEKAEAPAAEEGHEGHEGHGEEWLVDIGEHLFLGEMDLDGDEGVLVLTILDHHDRKPHVHEIGEATLNLVLEGGPKQLVMEAAPEEGTPEGSTSRYRAADPALKGKKELKGRLNLAFGGKTYVCDLAAAH